MSTPMNSLICAPACSLYEPVVQSDVSIDAMGRALVCEPLVDRVLPGMTVRMRRPRFLTALAVGAFLFQEHGSDAAAADARRAGAVADRTLWVSEATASIQPSRAEVRAE
jgi:hypothetical protein